MSGGARVVTADRAQVNWDLFDLEAWLPQQHRARTVVAFVAGPDLAPFYAAINSREGDAGRPALDPAVLLGRWLLAVTDGAGSARLLEKKTGTGLAYRRLRGGMPLNYHTLSGFRTIHAKRLDRVPTQSLAAFLAEGLVSLAEIIIDGTKVKASAGKGSFKTADGLAKAERYAAAHIAQLKSELDADPAAGTRREIAARRRAAEAAAAKAVLGKLVAQKAKRAKTHKAAEAKKSEPKASTSAPEARSMRFAGGAIAPGCNLQVAVTSGEGFIAGIVPTGRRNDSGLAAPMAAEVERRLGVAPTRLLADQVCACADDSIAFATRQTPVMVYAPVKPDQQDASEHAKRCREAKQAHEPQALKDLARAHGEPGGAGDPERTQADRTGERPSQVARLRTANTPRPGQDPGRQLPARHRPQPGHRHQAAGRDRVKGP